MSAPRPILAGFLAALLLLAAVPVRAQDPGDPQPPPPERSDPDVRIDPLQPDFNLAALPTTLRMPRHKWAFRVTHRFTRPLGQGNIGDLFSDFLGFDSSSLVGLELRFGLFRGTQVGVHRTSDKTIQLFAQHNFLNERDGAPLGLDALAALEGQRNLRDGHRGAFGVVASRRFGRRLAAYAEPIVVTNSNLAGPADDTTLLLGLGGRVRVRPSMYLIAEITPRVAGFDSGVSQMSFGLEVRPGGHLFQLNVSNGFGTTLGQLTSGAISSDQWYIGFNIARKFF